MKPTTQHDQHCSQDLVQLQGVIINGGTHDETEGQGKTFADRACMLVYQGREYATHGLANNGQKRPGGPVAKEGNVVLALVTLLFGIRRR